MLKKFAFAAVGLTLLASPLLVSAQSIEDLQAQIQALLAQLAAMQNNPPSPAPSPIPVPSNGSCVNLTFAMGPGDMDDNTNGEVSQLQQFLVNVGLLDASLPHGYFGPMTVRAVQGWQSKQGILSSGDPESNGYGYVGRKTRASMQCSGTTPPPPPVTPPPTSPRIELIQPSAYSQMTIGSQVSIAATIANAPSGSNICVRLIRMSDYSEFKYEGLCAPYQGGETQGISGILSYPIDGKQFTPGSYMLDVILYASIGDRERGSAPIATSQNTLVNLQNGSTTPPLPPPPPSAGTITASLDAGTSPAYSLVAGGTSGVTLGMFKFRASGENSTLKSLRIYLNPTAKPQDIIQLTVWDGANKVGTANLLGNNYGAVVLLTTPVVLLKDTDKVLTVKADLASIGVSQPGTAGDLVQIGLQFGFGDMYGTGQTSGTNIQATGSNASTAGVRIFRTYPTVALVSLPNDGLADGRLMRFRVSASPTGSVGISSFSTTISTISATVSNVQLYAYSDAAYTQPVNGGLVASQPVTVSSGPTQFILQGSQPVEIPPGGTYYFEIRGTVSASGSTASVATKLNGDISAMSPILATTNSATGAFIWSPNDLATSLFTSADWTNGYGLLPVNGISQVRTGSGGTVTPPSPPSPPAGYTTCGSVPVGNAYRESGSNNYILGNFAIGGDTLTSPTQSPVVLFENGVAMGPAHTLHADIRTSGAGRFSHWYGDLYFSTTDNSSPLSNGRNYTWGVPQGSSCTLTVSPTPPPPPPTPTPTPTPPPPPAPQYSLVAKVGDCNGTVFTFRDSGGATYRVDARTIAAPCRDIDMSVPSATANNVATYLTSHGQSVSSFVVSDNALCQGTFNPSFTTHETGNAYTAPIPTTYFAAGDTNESPSTSNLILYENGKPLGPPHSMHADIRSSGAGRYSHWYDYIYFSSSDNSDPSANGRSYTIMTRCPNGSAPPASQAAAVLSAVQSILEQILAMLKQ